MRHGHHHHHGHGHGHGLGLGFGGGHHHGPNLGLVADITEDIMEVIEEDMVTVIDRPIILFSIFLFGLVLV